MTVIICLIVLWVLWLLWNGRNSKIDARLDRIYEKHLGIRPDDRPR